MTVRADPESKITAEFSARPPAKSFIPVAVILILSAITIAIMTMDTPREVKGAVVVVFMLVLVFGGIPVGVAMGVAGAVGIWVLVGTRPLTGVLSEIGYTSAASTTLSVLPMFIFMGLLLWRSGITSQLYTAARRWTGWLPGGLAVTTNLAGAGLGAASGSTIGIAYAVGRIGIPEMLKYGYDKRLATGSVISAGTIGQLIPPSILLVVYAGIAEIPVGPQLLAGIIPGIILTVAYVLLTVGVAVAKPSFAPRAVGESGSWRERWTSLISIWPIYGLVTLIIGGMTGGFFTPTEAGAVGALAALIYCVHRLGMKDGFHAIVVALRDTLVSVGSIMFMLLGADILNRALALSGAAQWFATALSSAGLSAITFMLVLTVIYLVLGTFMDPIPMMLLTVPLVLPTAVSLGVNPLVLGVFLVLLGEIAIMSPPVGLLIFVVHRLAQDPLVRRDAKISLGDVTWGAIWYIPAALGVVLLIIFVPWLVEILPSLAAV